MRITSTIKIGAAMLLLSLILTSVRAQINIQNALLPNKQLKVGLITCLYQNLQFKHAGKIHLKSMPTPSAELNIGFYQHIKNNYGINMGVGLGFAPYNFHYKIHPPDSSIFMTGRINLVHSELDLIHFEYVNAYYNLLVTATKQFPTKTPNKYRTLELGAKLNYIVAFPYDLRVSATYMINDSTDARLFEMRTSNPAKRIMASCTVKYGWQKQLKTKNSFYYGFVLNYSPGNIGTGNYVFNHLTYPSYGSVKHKFNFVGFEISYGLTTSSREKKY